MSAMTEGNARQYATSEKLAARARLNQNYTIAETGWFEWVANRLPLAAGDGVLDIGCGPAWFWASIAGAVPLGLKLTLADQSTGMVEEAVGRCRSLGFSAVEGRVADAVELPFADGSFEAVIAMHMLYHVREQARAIAEMHRVLKPGGFLAVTTNGIDNMREIYELTTALGSDPVDPAGVYFGYDAAEKLLEAQFGNIAFAEHPARMRVTAADDVFLALTSYPPGDSASPEQLAAFRLGIEAAFARGGGALEVRKQTGLFLARKG